MVIKTPAPRLIEVLELAALKVAVFPVLGTGDAFQFPVVAQTPLDDPVQVALTASAEEMAKSERASDIEETEEWTH